MTEEDALLVHARAKVELSNDVRDVADQEGVRRMVTCRRLGHP